jgi:hypothetical protein
MNSCIAFHYDFQLEMWMKLWQNYGDDEKTGSWTEPVRIGKKKKKILWLAVWPSNFLKAEKALTTCKFNDGQKCN